MRLNSAIFAVFCCLLLASRAGAESGSFEVAQHGHSVGTASFKITPTSQGSDNSALVRVSMQGLNYSLSKNEQLASGGHLVQAELSATVNGSAVFLATKVADTQIDLDISANGRKTVTHLAAHANAVLLPDFDPGGLELLLTVAAAQNNHDVWAIIPRQAGSISPVQLATYADLSGKLDGKEIVVHHLVATIAGAKTDIFFDPANQLLQAELPQDGFALVRKGFVLTPPSKAPAAPPQPAPSSQSPSATAPTAQ